MVFFEPWAYTLGNLTGQGGWAATGGLSPLQVVAGGNVTHAIGAVAGDIKTDAAFPTNWQGPWTFTTSFSALTTLAGNNSDFFRFRFGNIAGVFVEVKLIWNLGTTLPGGWSLTVAGGGIGVPPPPTAGTASLASAHTFVVQWDGTTLHIFIDGVEENTQAFPAWNTIDGTDLQVSCQNVSGNVRTQVGSLTLQIP